MEVKFKIIFQMIAIICYIGYYRTVRLELFVVFLLLPVALYFSDDHVGHSLKFLIGNSRTRGYGATAFLHGMMSWHDNRLTKSCDQSTAANKGCYTVMSKSQDRFR